MKKEKLKYRGYSKGREYYCYAFSPKQAIPLLHRQALETVGSYNFTTLEVENIKRGYDLIQMNIDSPVVKLRLF